MNFTYTAAFLRYHLKLLFRVISQVSVTDYLRHATACRFLSASSPPGMPAGDVTTTTLRASMRIEGTSLDVGDGQFASVTTDTLLASGDVRTGGNIYSQLAVTAGTSVSAPRANFTSLAASQLLLPGVTFDTVGHITCNSLTATTGDVVAAGSVTATTSLSTSGSITGETVTTSGDITTRGGTLFGAAVTSLGDIISVEGAVRGSQVVARGDLVGEQVLGGSITASTGDITASVGNVVAAGSVVATTSLSTSGSITGETVTASGDITTRGGTLIGAAVTSFGDIISVEGAVRGSQVVARGDLVGEQVLGGSITASTGDITAVSGAIRGATLISTGDVTVGANLNADGQVRAAVVTSSSDISAMSGTVRGLAVEATNVSAVEVAAERAVLRSIEGETMGLSGDATSAGWGITRDTFIPLEVFQGTRTMNLAELGNGKTFMLFLSDELTEIENDEAVFTHVLVVDATGVGRADFFLSESLESVDFQLTCNGAPVKGGLSTMNTRSPGILSNPSFHRTLQIEEPEAGTHWTLTVTGNNECLLTAGAYVANSARFSSRIPGL